MISAAMQELTHPSVEMVKQSDSIGAVVEQNSAAMQEVSASAEEITARAQKLTGSSQNALKIAEMFNAVVTGGKYKLP